MIGVGVGGGPDVWSAYVFGFRDITGVELNPIFVDLLTCEFRDYNGLADLPGVRLVVDDARGWFARTNQRSLIMIAAISALLVLVTMIIPTLPSLRQTPAHLPAPGRCTSC